MTTCRTCQHWKPYFTGEEWGVRSFVDAPKPEQDRIREIINKRAPWSKAPSVYPARMDNRFKNWFEWGECTLAEMPEDENSLNSLAYAKDESGYIGILRCHYTFGCVQYLEVINA